MKTIQLTIYRYPSVVPQHHGAWLVNPGARRLASMLTPARSITVSLSLIIDDRQTSHEIWPSSRGLWRAECSGTWERALMHLCNIGVDHWVARPCIITAMAFADHRSHLHHTTTVYTAYCIVHHILQRRLRTTAKAIVLRSVTKEGYRIVVASSSRPCGQVYHSSTFTLCSCFRRPSPSPSPLPTRP